MPLYDEILNPFLLKYSKRPDLFLVLNISTVSCITFFLDDDIVRKTHGVVYAGIPCAHSKRNVFVLHFILDYDSKKSRNFEGSQSKYLAFDTGTELQ